MKKLFLSVFCIGALFASCSDDDDKIPEVIDPTYQAKNFIEDSKGKLKQEFKIKVSELPKTLTLSGGSKVEIPEKAFLINGEEATGDITLEIYEALKASDMIYTGTNTNAFPLGKTFISDGFIYVNASQGTTKVDQYTASPLKISMPTKKEANTETFLWSGRVGFNTTETAEQFTWDNANIEGLWSATSEAASLSVSPENGFFPFYMQELGWANLDIYWGEDLTSLEVTLTNTTFKIASYEGKEGDTYVFFKGKGVNALSQLYDMVNATTVKASYLPVGQQGRVIAYTVKDGKFFCAYQDITLTADMKVSLEPKSVSKGELETIIKGLDTL